MAGCLMVRPREPRRFRAFGLELWALELWALGSGLWALELGA